MKQDEADAALQEITVSMQVVYTITSKVGEKKEKKAVFLSLVSVTACFIFF